MGIRQAFVPFRCVVREGTIRLQHTPWVPCYTAERVYFLLPHGTKENLMSYDAERNGFHWRFEHPSFPDRGPEPPQEVWDDGGEGLAILPLPLGRARGDTHA